MADSVKFEVDPAFGQWSWGDKDGHTYAAGEVYEVNATKGLKSALAAAEVAGIVKMKGKLDARDVMSDADFRKVEAQRLKAKMKASNIRLDVEAGRASAGDLEAFLDESEWGESIRAEAGESERIRELREAQEAENEARA